MVDVKSVLLIWEGWPSAPLAKLANEYYKTTSGIVVVIEYGGVAEWLKALVSKTSIGATLS